MRYTAECPGCHETSRPMRVRTIRFDEVPEEKTTIFHEACERTIAVGPGLELVALPVGIAATPATIWALTREAA